jgi:hypothetical protein
MKTTSSVVVSRLQCFKRPASLIMAGLAAAVLVSSSVFAQTDNGLGPEMSIEHHGAKAASGAPFTADARWVLARAGGTSHRAGGGSGNSRD